MLSYIIATYAGNMSNKYLKNKVLDFQLETLYSIIKKKKENNIPNYVSNIIITVPKCDCKDIDKYYLWDKWYDWFDQTDTKLIKLDYVGENKHYSYDQWIQAVEYIDHDYYLFMEDDYCINPNELHFDMELINLYNNTFPKQIGYLCSFAIKSYNQYHAAVSTGLISFKTYKALGDNVLQQFYNTSHGNSQIAFSLLFLLNNIQIFDMYEHCHAIFWQSYDCTLHNIKKEKDCSDNSNKKTIIIPVQYLLEFNKKENMDLENNDKDEKWIPIKNICIMMLYQNHCKEAIELLINNNPINWLLLSSNPYAIDLLSSNIDKINWNNLSLNPNAIDLLSSNIDKINWNNLSLNTNAINLLSSNIDKINWNNLSKNINGVDLLLLNPDKINWDNLSSNSSDKALELLNNNIDKINWVFLSSNSNDKAIDLLIDNFYKINWEWLSTNTNKKALLLLKHNYSRINWNMLSCNPTIFNYIK